MPKVGEVGECPLCFGRLLPLSVCQSCNTVAAREGLDDVGPQIACEDCGATNPTHFVCSACNARFPYEEIVKPEGPTCPVCRNPVPPGAELCPHCSAVLPAARGADARPQRRIRGEYGEEDVHEVGRIPGVGRQRAEALCAAGYNALWKIARASEADLARVKGVGPRVASQIKENLRFLLLVGRRKSKEEVLSEEYACPLCGTVTSLFATRCHECGALFDEEELDEEFRKEVEREEDKGLLAYYDVRLLEEPESATLHYGRAVLLLATGRPADALASLDKVLELEPENARALQAKVRALSAAKGVGAAAQVLRGVVTAAARERRPEDLSPEQRKVEEEQALRSLSGLEEVECPECGEKQVPGATVCPVCGHRFAPEAPAAPGPEALAEDRLLEELERAVAGEARAPPPPLKPEVPFEVVERKRAMLTFLLKIPGVSRRAAEAVSGFFQDLEQVQLSEAPDLAEIPGVAPAEARLIKVAVDVYLAPGVPEEKAAPRPRPEAPGEVARRPRVTQPPEVPPPTPPAPRPSPGPAIPSRPPLVVAEGRRGLINGRGLVNGRGRVNGLINGTGFVNGSAVAELRLPQRHLIPRYIAIGSALIMFFSVVAVLNAPESVSTAPVQVDGNPQEWAGISAFNGIGSPPLTNPDVTIRQVGILHDVQSGTLFAHVRVAGTEAFGGATDYRTLYMFLDADGDAASGYSVETMGADYAARVSGGGAIESTALLAFSGSDPEDWNGWRAVGAVAAASAGGDLELAMAVSSLAEFVPGAFRVAAAFDDNAGSTSHTMVPIGTGRAALRILQETVSDSVSIGSGQALLRLSMQNLGNDAVRVESFAVQSNVPWSVNPAPPFDVDTVGRIVTVSVDTSGLSDGASVSAYVSSVLADAPYAVVGGEGRAYVGQLPPIVPKRVDGLFRDWSPQPDDPVDNPPVRRPSLNITGQDGAVVGNDLFLYARFDAAALEGTLLPQRQSRPAPPGGGGGGGGGSGPPPPPLVGRDYLRFYLDTNESEPAGSDAYGLLVDRYVEVRGRSGRVTDAFLYNWTGGRWEQETSVTVDTAVGGQDGKEIELRTLVPGATFNMTRLVAVAGDWSGVADRTNAVGTRGTRGGSNPPIALDVSGNGRFWFRDTDHLTEIACTYNKVAKSVIGSGPAKTIILSTGESACWYIDEIQDAVIPSGTWETLMDLTAGGSPEYDVRIEIWNLDSNTVAETIVSCLDQTTFTDDVRCFLDSVPSKDLTANQVVRLVLAHSSASGTVTIEYDDADTTGDSRATLPIPEFAEIVTPIASVLTLAAVISARRRRESKRR